ncbi:MAG: 50S ribosomal protein L23 [Acutalibacteraceae bacterium]
MNFQQDIIIAPVISEKSMTYATEKKYTFKVANDANKIQIKKAIEEVFPGTVVKKVNTVNVRGQKRRYGRYEGYTPSWKKAVVTLTEGSKTIDFFDGML